MIEAKKIESPILLSQKLTTTLPLTKKGEEEEEKKKTSQISGCFSPSNSFHAVC